MWPCFHRVETRRRVGKERRRESGSAREAFAWIDLNYHKSQEFLKYMHAMKNIESCEDGETSAVSRASRASDAGVRKRRRRIPRKENKDTRVYRSHRLRCLEHSAASSAIIS